MTAVLHAAEIAGLVASPIYTLFAIHITHRTLGAWRRRRCGCARCLLYVPHTLNATPERTRA